MNGDYKDVASRNSPADGDAQTLTVMDLVLLGFNSRVVALHRETGELLWSWKSPKGRGSYVAVLLDGDRVIASVQGYTYCLDPFTGRQLWRNPLKGTGVGVPSLVSMRGNSGSAGAAAIIAQQQAAAAAASAGG
ncbi:MAG: PQQ-binding-like beta-propeller repeat protein [Planctomycetaceae bacterium]